METLDIVRFAARAAAGLTAGYLIMIVVRILLTWFGRGSGMGGGGRGQGAESGVSRAESFLARFTDPYLRWFSRFRFLRIAMLDLSPVAAVAVLSALNSAFTHLSVFGRLSFGLILALLLRALWQAVSFLLGFFLVLLILRAVFLLFRIRLGVFSDVVSQATQPILYRLGRFFFGRRLVHYRVELILSLLFFALLYVGGNFAVSFAIAFLSNLPF